MDASLTYRVGGRQNAGSITDGLDVFERVFDFVLQEAALEFVIELLFGFLEFL